MTAPWSVRPLHPAPGKPATAVTIHADDAAAREGMYELARAMTVAQFEALRELVRMYDNEAADRGHGDADERYRPRMDDVLDEVCCGLGHDLTGLWRVRVGVEEIGAFWTACAQALQPASEGGAA